MSIFTILIILLLLGCFGSFPAYSYNRSWGYAPFGGMGVLLLIILIVFFFRR